MPQQPLEIKLLQEKLRAGVALFTDSCINPFGMDQSNVSDLRSLSGIVEFSPADQVVVVRSGTTLDALNQELAAHGQCIPHHFPVDLGDPMLHQLLGAALPHDWEGPYGTWRSWVLGMTILGADGVLAKCGSRAVKNVAGYDVPRIMLGARGTLGIITEVILRTYPIAALPPKSEPRPWDGLELWIQRVLPTDLEASIGGRTDVISVDPQTATIWSASEPAPRANSWIIGPGARISQQATPMALMIRTKATFDPTGLLNPGALGIGTPQ